MGNKVGYKHGLSHTKLYRIWEGMRFRCEKGDKYYDKYYVERGIKVCDDWKDNFLAFREWALNNGYQDGLTIDRIDNYGDYCPENCRWVTTAEQNRNRTNNRRIEYNGKTQTLAEWAKELSINYWTLIYRFDKLGMTSEEAFETPVNKDRFFRYNGQIKTLKEWSKCVNVPYKTLCKRQCNGWSIEKMLTTPYRCPKRQAEEDAIYGYG